MTESPINKEPITIRERDPIHINNILFTVSRVRRSKVEVRPVPPCTVVNHVMQFDPIHVGDVNMKAAMFISTWQRMAREIQLLVDAELEKDEPSELAIEMAKVIGIAVEENPVKIVVEDDNGDDV